MDCRYKINQPVEPTGLVGKRVSVRWSRPEKLDGAETLTEHWHQGYVSAYSKGECKHTVCATQHPYKGPSLGGC